ncbi:hypothetical protein [Bordetella sp. N]|uniref:hypothetical protein n=1 Tax=Bordetella sp. N TaxID=1746199 RepID=UPI000708DBB0|nr:hypothetical protein [Bordetella sp. N]ALM82326.1 hypothetical protein ASB57_04530 [Bordetella sp. N]
MTEDEKLSRPLASESARREDGSEDLGLPGGTASGIAARSWERALEAIEAFLDKDKDKDEDRGKDKTRSNIALQPRQVIGRK